MTTTKRYCRSFEFLRIRLRKFRRACQTDLPVFSRWLRIVVSIGDGLLILIFALTGQIVPKIRRRRNGFSLLTGSTHRSLHHYRSCRRVWRPTVRLHSPHGISFAVSSLCCPIV